MFSAQLSSSSRKGGPPSTRVLPGTPVTRSGKGAKDFSRREYRLYGTPSFVSRAPVKTPGAVASDAGGAHSAGIANSTGVMWIPGAFPKFILKNCFDL